MSKNVNSGHAINVDNFQKLTNAVTDMGADYQPTNGLYLLTALTALLTLCKAGLQGVIAPFAAYNRVVSERAALYAPLNKLVTRLLNMFYSTEAPKQVKDLAKTKADQIRGVDNRPKPDKDKETPPPTEDADTPSKDDDDSNDSKENKEDNQHSVSQQTFVQRADNFATFIGILAAEPSYAPNEGDLKVVALQALLARMVALNNDADLAYRALKKARNTRDESLYTELTGLVDVALGVKTYVKGAFGTDHPFFKAIKSLRFTRPSKD